MDLIVCQEILLIVSFSIIEFLIIWNLISADKWFAKALRRFENCLLVNNNVWGKLVSLSPIIFDDNLKTTPVSFFIADLNLLSCEFDNFIFKLLCHFILIKIKIYFAFNYIYKTFTVTCENSKIVSFASSRMK